MDDVAVFSLKSLSSALADVIESDTYGVRNNQVSLYADGEPSENSFILDVYAKASGKSIVYLNMQHSIQSSVLHNYQLCISLVFPEDCDRPIDEVCFLLNKHFSKRYTEYPITADTATNTVSGWSSMVNVMRSFVRKLVSVLDTPIDFDEMLHDRGKKVISLYTQYHNQKYNNAKYFSHSIDVSNIDTLNLHMEALAGKRSWTMDDVLSAIAIDPVSYVNTFTMPMYRSFSEYIDMRALLNRYVNRCLTGEL